MFDVDFNSFINNFNRALSINEDSLLKSLNNISNIPLPKDTQKIDFECFTDGFRIGFYPMTNDETQLGYQVVLKNIINDYDFIPYPDDYNFDNSQFDDQIESYYKSLNKMFFSWFNKIWRKSNFYQIKTPCYFSFHDGEQITKLNIHN